MKKLEGKIAVVTGAFKGIDASIAKHFATEGANRDFNSRVSTSAKATEPTATL